MGEVGYFGFQWLNVVAAGYDARFFIALRPLLMKWCVTTQNLTFESLTWPLRLPISWKTLKRYATLNWDNSYHSDMPNFYMPKFKQLAWNITIVCDIKHFIIKYRAEIVFSCLIPVGTTAQQPINEDNYYFSRNARIWFIPLHLFLQFPKQRKHSWITFT